MFKLATTNLVYQTSANGIKDNFTFNKLRTFGRMPNTHERRPFGEDDPSSGSRVVVFAEVK